MTGDDIADRLVKGLIAVNKNVLSKIDNAIADAAKRGDVVLNLLVVSKLLNNGVLRDTLVLRRTDSEPQNVEADSATTVLHLYALPTLHATGRIYNETLYSVSKKEVMRAYRSLVLAVEPIEGEGNTVSILNFGAFYRQFQPGTDDAVVPETYHTHLAAVADLRSYLTDMR